MESPSTQNHLSYARSAYLRSAMHQPVDWHEWGNEAFTLAQQQDKPILLDIGAVWCHWCHVMDRESYEDSTLAKIINERYIAVKVDRDERPDIDARYQAAVSSISGQGGWPLTAVLTPDGRPFFGGTYFPREDRYNRPGFGRVLVTMAEAWHQQKEEVLESAGSVISAIEHSESFAGRHGELRASIVDKILESAIAQYDPHNGGFGSQPKFSHPSTVDLLLHRAAKPGGEQAREVALRTLENMAKGGVYDQLGGGFHRYSVDAKWIVPHFEKMSYDNSELLRNYIHAFRLTGDEQYADVARDILRWLREVLTDQENGGFYASQDADIDLDDDGDYFTWTEEEVRAELSEQEFEAAKRWFDIGAIGDMHHDPKRNVLYRRLTFEQLAGQLGVTPEQAKDTIAVAEKKLLAARRTRTAPFVDKTLYTGWNAMCVRAVLEATETLGVETEREFALKTLDRLLAEVWSPNTGLAHVIAYAEKPATDAAQVPGVLEDYAFTAEACLEAWRQTGEFRYYKMALSIAEAMIDGFYDATGGGFTDTDPRRQPALGALAAKRKPLQDSPTPAGNPVAVLVLLKLHELGAEREAGPTLREIAEDTLEAFAGIAEHFGLYAATFGIALEVALNEPEQIVIVGDAEESLTAVAHSGYSLYRSTVNLSAATVRLPPALSATIPALTDRATPVALVCRGNNCLPPVHTSQELEAALRS